MAYIGTPALFILPHTIAQHKSSSVWDLYRARAVCTSEGRALGSIYIQHKGGTILCTVKTTIQLTCTDRPYKANHRIGFGARMSIQYSTVR